MTESLEFVILRILELEERHSKAETNNCVQLKVINYLSKICDLGGSRESRPTFWWHISMHGIGTALGTLFNQLSQQPHEENGIIISFTQMRRLRQREPLAQDYTASKSLRSLLLTTALCSKKVRIKGILMDTYIGGVCGGQHDPKHLIYCADLIVHM